MALHALLDQHARAMLLTVLDSCSASAASRAHRSSGRTTWILGDFGLPLDEVCRVGTLVLQW